MPFVPKFSITSLIANALNSIERARGFLEAANLSETWVEKMQERAFTLEAHHTTHIEGTRLTLDQSEKLLLGEKMEGVDSEDVKELLNYRKAFDFVADYVLSEGIITEGLIREIHLRLVEGVRGNSADPGNYRKVQNFVANAKTREIIYTPPPAYEVPLLMAEMIEWIKKEKSIPSVLVAGIAQFQLVHIHPFLDGNGRTARLLSTLCLYSTGYDFRKLFTISEYYDRNREEYYRAIQSVRKNDMDMTAWLEYFTKALETQMIEIQSKGTYSLQLDFLEEKYQLSPRQKQALEGLVDRKTGFSIQDYELLCPNVNRRTLQRDLADLVEKGFVSQKGIKKGVHYIVNPSVWDISKD